MQRRRRPVGRAAAPVLAAVAPTLVAGPLLSAGILLSGLAAGCVSLEEPEALGADVGLRRSELGDMSHVSVCGDVWLGCDPSAQDLGIASRRGIEVVVDLRSHEKSSDGDRLDVEALAGELSLTYLRADVDPERLDEDALDRALAALAEKDRGAVLLLSDEPARSAFVLAVHRVVDEGLSLEDALEEAHRAGMKPGDDSRKRVRRQVARLRFRRARDG